MICGKCGAQMPDDAKFCTRCGSRFAQGNSRRIAGYCPSCGAAMYEGGKGCENCGWNTEPNYDGGVPNDIPYTVPVHNLYTSGPDSDDNFRVNDDMNVSGNTSYSTGNNGNNGGNSNTTLITVLVVVIIALIGGIIAFFVLENTFLGDKDETAPTEKPTTVASPIPLSTPTPMPTPTPTPTPTPSGINTNPGITEYMYESDVKLVTESDLSKLTQAETRLLLNELYARRGYIFNTQEYRNYFSGKTWYVPRYTSQSDVEAQFNSIEMENKNIISNYEKSKGWR